MLTAAERDQLLVEWNNTAADFPSEKFLHQLFEEQVSQTPNSIAVEFQNKSLTYAELNRKANQLAHYLRELGVRPEWPVAICIERSLEMVVALLAVLKAGGAYVPIDPAYPLERVRFILQDSAPLALLTQSNLREMFPDLNGATAFSISRPEFRHGKASP